ncbi:MAG TPA: hypothetical protein VJ045_03275 [Hyphomicrobiaceae bacterium]|nr:hypothetical protein [Hyphomicrobiaceae bacterium]
MEGGYNKVAVADDGLSSEAVCGCDEQLRVGGDLFDIRPREISRIAIMAALLENEGSIRLLQSTLLHANLGMT